MFSIVTDHSLQLKKGGHMGLLIKESVGASRQRYWSYGRVTGRECDGQMSLVSAFASAMSVLILLPFHSVFAEICCKCQHTAL